jgi:hypothetical protein
VTILQGDIKLIASQVMSDTEVGGGGPSAEFIPDGVSNAIFPDISELDRAVGRVNLRKVFPFIDTNNLDGFYGANVIIAKPYEDPRVSVTLFSTGDTFDRRPEAASRMESYLAKGTTYSGYLFGNHIAGQMQVALLQRQEVADPVVGSTFVLTKNEGLSNEFSQFIRVTAVSSTIRTFTDSVEDFTRKQVILDISDPLQQDFPGFDAQRLDSALSYSGKTRTSDTLVADASRYYGTVKLREAASLGDYTIKGDGIYTQLVPSTRVEVPITDARMNQQLSTLTAAGGEQSLSLNLNFNTTQAMFVGGGILPGSLSVARGGITLTDSGGVLYNGGAQVGTVDYDNGILRLTTNVWGDAGTYTVTLTPATAPALVGQSVGLAVTAESQRLTWALTLDPIPARGSLTVSFRSLGRWYVLSDDGSGALRGTDSSYGAGTLNYSTGTVSVTLGAMPDVDSKIMLAWAPGATSTTVASVPQTSPNTRGFDAYLSLPTGSSIKPGSVTITWNDGAPRTATDSNGTLVGDATGAVFYGGQGSIRFRPNALPAPGTVLTIDITEATPQEGSVGAFTDGGANWTFSLGGSAVKANTVELSVPITYPVREFPGTDRTQYALLRVFDDGAGNLKIANVDSNLTVGSVNYANGACTLVKSFANFKSYQPTFAKRFPLGGAGEGYVEQTGFETRLVTPSIVNGAPGQNLNPPQWGWWTGPQDAAVEYRYAGSDGSSQTFTTAMNQIRMNGFSSQTYGADGASMIVRSFTLGARRYTVRAYDIEKDTSPTTGVGTDVGDMVGYSATMYDWEIGASPVPTSIDGTVSPAVGTTTGSQLVGNAVFRTAISPLLNGGFNLVGKYEDGTQFNVTANNAGVISTGSAPLDGNDGGGTPYPPNAGTRGVFAKIDYENGIAEVYWGKRVSTNWATNDETVIDISHLGLPGVTRIQLSSVFGESLRYNAVGYNYLPLDPDILGLNPVRLPADGRVPIFRPGTVVVIGNQKVTSPATVSNGQSINLARTRLSRVRVIDDSDQVITDGYTANLDTGIVTFINVAGYDQPIRIEHRIEDMLLVSAVQLNGDLTCTRPVTHDYDADDSYISSALLIGDMQAYVGAMFDQATWNGSFTDSQVGSPATGTYDDATYPIVLTNKGTLTERWALHFDGNTSFRVIGEHVGQIAIGNIASDLSPINPRTGAPYFTIQAEGWGAGWAVGNVLRFNTFGAQAPIWLVRTILQGPETVTDDSFLLLTRGDIDRP